MKLIRIFFLISLFSSLMSELLSEEIGDYGKIMKGIAYEARNADCLMWVIDRSPSMEDDIKEVHRRIENLMKSYEQRGKEVPVGVVTFADRPKLELKPTKKLKEIKSAIGKIKTQGAGKEALYQAVQMAFDQYPRKSKKPYFIVVTDEAGDDSKSLEKIVNLLARKKVKTLVLSPQATFGQRDWHWNIVSSADAKTTFFNSQNGPESYTQEAIYDFTFIQRSTWSSTVNQMEERGWAIKAGWAPFGLQLLANKTEGKVFELKTDTCRLRSIFEKKEKYLPDLNFPSLVKRNISKHPWRKVVDEAVNYWNKNFSPIEREFPGRSKKVLIQGIESQLKIIKKNIRVCSKTLDKLKVGITQKRRSSYLEEEGLRWRANCELAYASVLVARFHLHQFLADFERFKEPTFWPDPQNDVCQFNIRCVPENQEVNLSDLLERYVVSSQSEESQLINLLDLVDPTAKEQDLVTLKGQAALALAIVAHNHPRTPWATMAEAIYRRMGHYDIFINHCGQWGSGSQSQ